MARNLSSLLDFFIIDTPFLIYKILFYCSMLWGVWQDATVDCEAKMPWIGVDKFGGDCYGTVRELTEIREMERRG